jgi:hypothetical protein
MGKSEHLFRVILTFRGPVPNDFRTLNAFLKNSKQTITQQHMYLAYPDTELLFCSSIPAVNSAALDVLSRQAITIKTVEELKKLA